MPEHENKSFKEIHWEDYKLQEEMHKKGQQQHDSQEHDENYGNKQDENSEVQNQHGHPKQTKEQPERQPNHHGGCASVGSTFDSASLVSGLKSTNDCQWLSNWPVGHPPTDSHGDALPLAPSFESSKNTESEFSGESDTNGETGGETPGTSHNVNPENIEEIYGPPSLHSQ